MSEQKRNVRDEAWAKNAPEYFVEGIAIMVETRDEARALLTRLNEREAELRGREQMLQEQREAFSAALVDMRAFANQIYGPDSELTKINTRLADLPRVGDVERRLDEHDGALSDLKSRVTELENQRKTA